MKISTQEINQWLSETGRSRAWLATQCGVSLGTVNGWLAKGSKRAIPAPTLKLIHGLMDDSMSVDPTFTLAQYEALLKSAESYGMSVEEYVKAKLLYPETLEKKKTDS